jgi:hypothetical protein
MNNTKNIFKLDANIIFESKNKGESKHSKGEKIQILSAQDIILEKDKNKIKDLLIVKEDFSFKSQGYRVMVDSGDYVRRIKEEEDFDRVVVVPKEAAANFPVGSDFLTPDEADTKYIVVGVEGSDSDNVTLKIKKIFESKLTEITIPSKEAIASYFSGMSEAVDIVWEMLNDFAVSLSPQRAYEEAVMDQMHVKHTSFGKDLLIKIGNFLKEKFNWVINPVPSYIFESEEILKVIASNGNADNILSMLKTAGIEAWVINTVGGNSVEIKVFGKENLERAYSILKANNIIFESKNISNKDDLIQSFSEFIVKVAQNAALNEKVQNELNTIYNEIKKI